MPYCTKHCEQLTKEEELSLWEKMRGGDKDARDRLVESCIPWAITRGIYHYKLHASKAGDVGRITEEEMVSAALYGLMQCVDGFDARKSRLTTFSTNAIWWECHRTIVDKSLRLIRNTLVDMNSMVDRRSAFDPVRESQRRENAERVREAMQELEPRDRFVLRSRCWEGKTLDELAKIMSISNSRVNQIEFRARDRMAVILGKRRKVRDAIQ